MNGKYLTELKIKYKKLIDAADDTETMENNIEAIVEDWINGSTINWA